MISRSAKNQSYGFGKMSVTLVFVYFMIYFTISIVGLIDDIKSKSKFAFLTISILSIIICLYFILSYIFELKQNVKLNFLLIFLSIIIELVLMNSEKVALKNDKELSVFWANLSVYFGFLICVPSYVLGVLPFFVSNRSYN